MEKDLAEMNYSEFSEYFDAHEDEFLVVLNYDDFIVYREIKTARYFYYEVNESSTENFYELDLVASVWFLHDQDQKTEDLITLFDCDCCGEVTHEYDVDGIVYQWFKRKID